MKNAVFWDVMLCGGNISTNVVPSLPILVTLMMVATRSSKTSVLTRATWCSILENNILHFTLKFGNKTTGYCIITMHHQALPSLPRNFLPKTT
jgi:hypothetical protein